MWDLKSDQGLLTDRYRFHLLVFGKLVDSRILFCSLGFTWSFRMLHWLPLQHNIGIQERTNSGKCGVLCFDLTSLWCIATKYRMFCEKQATRSNGVVQFRCDSYWHRITSHAIASCWEREVHEGIQSIYYIFTQRYWSTFGKNGPSIDSVHINPYKTNFNMTVSWLTSAFTTGSIKQLRHHQNFWRAQFVVPRALAHRFDDKPLFAGP